MSNVKPPKVPASIADEIPRDLIVQFLAEIMRSTGTPRNQKTFQLALQKYVDGLRPWLEPNDGPTHPQELFTLIEQAAFDESGENVTVVLSPEAEALFRAWLRRNKIASDAGLNTAHAWSN